MNILISPASASDAGTEHEQIVLCTVPMDKCAQYEALRRFTPELSFEGWRVEQVSDLPLHLDRTLVIRPSVSPNTEGSALIAGPQRPLSREDLDWLSLLGGPYQVHVYETGQPLFLNGVMSSVGLLLTDAWNCLLHPIGCRDVLVGVVSYPLKMIPSALVLRLESLASAIGIHCGPVHFELVLTMSGAKVVKFAARSAFEPIPTLCHLGGWPSQAEVWNYLQAKAHPSLQFAWKSDASDDLPYVGDFSFVFRQSNRFSRFIYQTECECLDSFAGYISLMGQTVQTAVNGVCYGVTIKLKNWQLQQLVSDVERLMILNQRGAFVFS